MRSRCWPPLLLALLAAGAAAQDASIKLEQAVGPAGLPRVADSKTAAYVTILNSGAAPDALVSATADVAQSVRGPRDAHHVRHGDDGARAQAGRCAPGARVELKPGGYHLMLIGLKRALESRRDASPSCSSSSARRDDGPAPRSGDPVRGPPRGTAVLRRRGPRARRAGGRHSRPFPSGRAPSPT